MSNGVIYPIISWLIEQLKKLNAVEWFKWVAKKLSNANGENQRTSSRVAVDVFIISKWLFIIAIWATNYNNTFFTNVVWYLIISNLFTYFYYHIWTKDLISPHFNFDRIRRRFLNLFLSIFYNIFCFAYLIEQAYKQHFVFFSENARVFNAIVYSVANSFSGSFSKVEAVSSFGETLILIETFSMFIFLTIILSNSIPQPKTS